MKNKPTEKELKKSRYLNLNRIAKHPNAKALAQHLLEKIMQLPRKPGKHKPRRSTLRPCLEMLLVELYHNYLTTPERYLGVSLDSRWYSALPPRYNPLNIAYRPMVHAVRGLDELDYIDLYKGSKWAKRNSRIRHMKKLADLFAEYKLTSDCIHTDKKEEVIILRDIKDEEDETAKRLGYTETKQTRKMRREIKAYNKRLEKTYIDIAFDFSRVELPEPVNLAQKSVRRIFNNGSFKDGGRLYNAFWIKLPSFLRRYIVIDGQETIEADYSGIHIALLYAQEGINPLGMDDPYSLGGPYQNTSKLRHLLKNLLLIMVNAKTESGSITSLKKKIRQAPEEYPDPLPDIKEVIAAFKEKHKPIAHYLGTGAGVQLQFTDSQIAMAVVERMAQQGEIILTIHDSFICRKSAEAKLCETMQTAFREVVTAQYPKTAFMNEVLGIGIKADDKWYSTKVDLPPDHHPILSAIFKDGEYKSIPFLGRNIESQQRREKLWRETRQTTFYESEGQYFITDSDEAKEQRPYMIFEAKHLDAMHESMQKAYVKILSNDPMLENIENWILAESSDPLSTENERLLSQFIDNLVKGSCRAS